MKQHMVIPKASGSRRTTKKRRTHKHGGVQMIFDVNYYERDQINMNVDTDIIRTKGMFLCQDPYEHLS